MHLEDNKIDKVQWGEEEGVGIRLIKEGKTYYGYTTEITYENLLEIAKDIGKGARAWTRSHRQEAHKGLDFNFDRPG
jgi:predicted Zn-dependent protease